MGPSNTSLFFLAPVLLSAALAACGGGSGGSGGTGGSGTGGSTAGSTSSGGTSTGGATTGGTGGTSTGGTSTGGTGTGGTGGTSTGGTGGQGGCHSAEQCPPSDFCYGPEDVMCGIPPQTECFGNGDCAAGQVCHSMFDSCSPDQVGSQCGEPCKPDVGCGDGFDCSADGSCVPTPCGDLPGTSCPISQVCDVTTIDPQAAAPDRTNGCVKISCQADATCPQNTFCVNGYCQTALGVCMPPVP